MRATRDQIQGLTVAMNTLIVANEVESRHRRDDRVKCDDERRKAEEVRVKQEEDRRKEEEWRAHMLDYLRSIETL
jgi:hypothetical protein